MYFLHATEHDHNTPQPKYLTIFVIPKDFKSSDCYFTSNLLIKNQLGFSNWLMRSLKKS